MRDTPNIAGAVVGLALIVLLGFSLWSLFNLDVPAPNKDVLLIVIGALTTKVGTIVDYYYGGSVAKPKPPASETTVLMQPGDVAKVSAAPNGDTKP